MDEQNQLTDEQSNAVEVIGDESSGTDKGPSGPETTGGSSMIDAIISEATKTSPDEGNADETVVAATDDQVVPNPEPLVAGGPPSPIIIEEIPMNNPDLPLDVPSSGPVTNGDKPPIVIEELPHPDITIEEIPVKPQQKDQTSSSPHILTDEEILERGVTPADKEEYRRFHSRQLFSPNKWHKYLQEHTFDVEFLTLTSEEINALLLCSHSPNGTNTLYDEHKDVLDQLKEKLDTCLCKFGDAGAFIKLNGKIPTDSFMERDNGEYLQSVQEGILNELEIENQFVNAYLIWRSWRSTTFRDSYGERGGVLRRSLRRIQRTLHRNQTNEAATTTEDHSKQEKSEPLTASEPAPVTANGDESAATGQDVAAPVTVQATIEGGQEESTTMTDSEPVVEPIPANTEPVVDTEPVIELAEKPQESTDEILPVVTSSPSKSKNDNLFIRVKQETMQNKVLHAFLRTMYSQFQMRTGAEILNVLMTSAIVREELKLVKKYMDIPETEAVLSIIKWNAIEVPRCPGMTFRAFVYDNNLTALTQYDDVLYVPNISRFHQTIQFKLQYFFNNVLKKSFPNERNYIVDLFIAPNKVYVLDMYPFHTSVGACLFTWKQSQNQLMNGPFEFRFISNPYRSCFTGLMSHWQNICENITRQKRDETNRANSKCTLL